MKRDPWVVLGVSRAAGPADWKKAYRRLAMRWHPDRNPDPQATERFKEINAAYEALLAVDAPEMPETEAPPAAETATETAEAAPQAADIRLNLELTLAEAAHGCRKTVRYHRGKPCGTCAGSGEAGMARTRFCDACHGSGRVRDAARVLVKCPACQGRGLFTERICPDCHGSGREHAEAVLEIAVPPGMLAGDDLRLAGQGEPGDGELLPGDLYLTVILRTHPLFELRGRDLCFSMPVSALALLSGEEIELPTLDGRLRHRLTPGGISESTLRLPGRGYPGRGRQPAGDLVVNLLPLFPRALDEGERKALSRVHALLMANAETCLPAVAEWQRRLREENL